jgi:lipopolysaccharide/colanic/teichoic acid biosynthesis glycosyltransferase
VSKKVERLALLAVDLITVNIAYLLYRGLWSIWGARPDAVLGFSEQPQSMILLSLFWIVLFFFTGLYRGRFAASRFDELVSVAKVITLGLLLLFFAVFSNQMDATAARLTLFLYWGCMSASVATGRIVLRSVQKRLILRGYGMHRAIIVGWDDRVDELFEEVMKYPAAGLQVVDTIKLQRSEQENASLSSTALQVGQSGLDQASVYSQGDGHSSAGAPVSADRYPMAALPGLIDRLNVQDVVIALGPEDNRSLMQLLRYCDGNSVSLKIVPDFYTIIGGMARSEHMYGVPMIEVLPEPIPAWEQTAKRLMDAGISLLVLLLGLPLWLAIGVLVRLTSPGPAIYCQQRVGRYGNVFTMYKFRTMRQNAEASTGPVWATEDDPRYTNIGRILRKTRIDEVPQFWNVLKGDMSLVGPRPERPYFVNKLMEEIPLYNRRHRVKPGLTGLAQVKWKYDSCLDDVRQKVKYDLFYIENMSLRMDAKILFQTIRAAFRSNGQ